MVTQKCKWDGSYPVRCRIVDVTGLEVLPGLKGRTPDESKPHVGRMGLAEEMADRTVRITLDDGKVWEGQILHDGPLNIRFLRSDGHMYEIPKSKIKKTEPLLQPKEPGEKPEKPDEKPEQPEPPSEE